MPFIQHVLQEPTSDWRPTPVHELPSWEGAKRIAVDIETHDPLLKTVGPSVRHGGSIAGYSFAIEDGPAHYVPVRHLDSRDNLDPARSFKYLREQAKNFKGELVGANLQYDLDYLEEAGVKFSARRFRDVQVAEPLLDENQFQYSLQAIGERRGFGGKDETLLRQAAETYGIDPKAEMYKLAGRYVGPYAIHDVVLPLQLIRAQEEEISRQGLDDIYDIECRLLPALVAMRRRGVRIDIDALDRFQEWAVSKEMEAMQEFNRHTSYKLDVSDINKARAIKPALEDAGISLPKTKTGEPSVKKEVLETIDHPIITALLDARRINKARTTFAESIRTHMVDGRIHTTFNQLKREKDGGGGTSGTIGRLSSTHPNLQQQPSRDPEIGPRWRSIYVPEDDCEWACLDFSQQEPRWMAHYGELERCVGGPEAAASFRADPRIDNHQMMADMAGISRKAAKTILLGLSYGMGGAKLCRSLGLPTDWWTPPGQTKALEVAGRDGKDLIKRFNDRVGYIRGMSIRAQKAAIKRGWIKTAGGRICRFPKFKDGPVMVFVDGTRVESEYMWTQKAFNRLIQGTSADQMKTAMVAAHEAGFVLQLQVHDELDLSIENRQVAMDLAELMVDAFPCNVPHVVDVEIGPSWGEIQDVRKADAT